MGLVRRETSWNTLTLLLGTFIGAINTMLLFPLFLTKEEYGLTRVLAEVSLIAAQFAIVGTPNLLLKFMPEFKVSKGNTGGLFPFVIRVSIIGFLIVTALLYFGHSIIVIPYEENAGLFVKYYFLLYPMVVFSIVNFILSNFAKSIYKSVFQLFIKEVLLRLAQTFLVLLLFFNQIDFVGFVYGFVVLHAITGILIFLYLLKLKELSIKNKQEKTRLDNKTIIGFLKYSFANFLTGISSTLANKIDMLMISSMVGVVASGNQGLEATAIYAFSSYVVALIEMPARALDSIVNSLISKAWLENDIKTLKLIYQKSALNQFVAGLFLFILVVVNIEYVVEFIKNYSGNDYALAIPVVLFLGLGKLFHVANGVNGQIIVTSKYYYVGTILLLFLAVFTFVLNYFMIPVYGLVGASVATAITVFSFNIISFVFLVYKYKIQPFSFAFFKVIFIGLLTFSVYFLPDTNFWLFNLVYKSFLIGTIYLPLVYFLNVSEDVTNIANKWLVKFGILKQRN